MKKHIVTALALTVTAAAIAADTSGDTAAAPHTTAENATVIIGAVCGLLGWILPAPFGGIFSMIGNLFGKRPPAAA